MSDIWPTQIRLHKDKRTLTVSFDNHESYDFPAEFLRVTSPSAEVQGHGQDQKKTVGGKKDVEIMQIDPVGNYAVRLVFTDLHDTGYYTWDYFLEHGRGYDEIWQGYLAELEEKGLTRD
ncbi:MAG: DUF971 domain-containing protein [Cohaesibacter sp.]|jgi:DUF971 family protein|nr:DUF971 domain-containing protein [Cohaesibacter sp.]